MERWMQRPVLCGWWRLHESTTSFSLRQQESTFMDVSNVREILDQECNFPADKETIVEQVGDTELEALEAHETEAETIATVLDRTEESTFHSVADAYNAILGAVTDPYVGRKYYDDRGGARHSTREQAGSSTL